MIKKLNTKIILILIFIIAVILRFYQLGDFPQGLDADEASWGYNAYSILRTGADENGIYMPLIIESFGDYKGAIYSYLIIPFIYIFDLTILAVRMPSAIFASLSLILIFFITKQLTGKAGISLTAAFLFAISSWSINLSRVAADFNLAFFLLLLLIYCLLRIRNSFSNFWLSIALAAGFISILTYTAARFYMIITAFIFILSSLELAKGRFRISKSFMLVFIFLLISGAIYTKHATISRFSQVSIFSSPETQLVLDEQLREDQFQLPLTTRVTHNKLINYSRTFLYNYSQYFTFDFLFLSGGFPFRERIPSTGLLYLWQFPFLLLGIYYCVKKKNFLTFFLFSWIALMLIPTAVTYDEVPNVHRSMVIMPPLLIIISIGLYNFLDFKIQKFKRIIFCLVIFAAIYEFYYFLHQYFVHFPVHRPWYRGYANELLVKELTKYSSNYKKIVITKSQGNPYIYLLFFGKYDPGLYQQSGSLRDNDFKGFGKYVFSPRDCPISGGAKGEDKVVGKPGVLYVNKGSCVLPLNNVKHIGAVNWNDNTPAFQLVEYVATTSAGENASN